MRELAKLVIRFFTRSKIDAELDQNRAELQRERVMRGAK